MKVYLSEVTVDEDNPENLRDIISEMYNQISDLKLRVDILERSETITPKKKPRTKRG